MIRDDLKEFFSGDVKKYLYAIIVLLLLVTVYMLGQISTQQTISFIQQQCPQATIHYATPFSFGLEIPAKINFTVVANQTPP